MFSGYKSQRTKGHREEEKGRTRRQKQKNTGGDKNREINPEKEGDHRNERKKKRATNRGGPEINKQK